jgi:hypothetical protein
MEKRFADLKSYLFNSNTNERLLKHFNCIYKDYITTHLPILYDIKTRNQELLGDLYRGGNLNDYKISIIGDIEIEQEIIKFVLQTYGFLFTTTVNGGRVFTMENGTSKRSVEFNIPVEDYPELLNFVEGATLFTQEPEEPSEIKKLRDKYNNVDFCSLPEEFVCEEQDLNVFTEYFQNNQSGIPIEETIKKDLKKNTNKEELFAKLLIWFDNLEETVERQKAEKKNTIKASKGIREQMNSSYNSYTFTPPKYIPPLKKEPKPSKPSAEKKDASHGYKVHEYIKDVLKGDVASENEYMRQGVDPIERINPVEEVIDAELKVDPIVVNITQEEINSLTANNSYYKHTGSIQQPVYNSFLTDELIEEIKNNKSAASTVPVGSVGSMDIETLEKYLTEVFHNRTK